MRDRLIELIADKWLSGIYDMADHLLANGVISLPCKVGDVVYCIRKNPYAKGKYIKENTVLNIAWNGKNFLLFTTKEDVFGKTVFLSKEEAKQALQALRKEDESNVQIVK